MCTHKGGLLFNLQIILKTDNCVHIAVKFDVQYCPVNTIVDTHIETHLRPRSMMRRSYVANF